MAKRKSFVYPQHVAQRSGCKVGWLYFDTEEKAKQAVKVAKAEAKHLASQGYDYGYRAPGYEKPEQIKEGEHAGLWEVVIP